MKQRAMPAAPRTPRPRLVSNPDKILVYGPHAVHAVIMKHPELVTSISIVEEKLRDFRDAHASFFSKTRTPLHPVRNSDLDKYTGNAVHQGVVATISQYPYAELDLIIKPKTQKDVVVLMDGIQDPHNLGAIARGAVAFGARAILITEHGQAPVTSVAIKSSVGTIFEIPVIKIGNINQTVTKMKEAGWWIAGLTMSGDDVRTYNHDTPLVLVIGSEGDGISHGVTTKCDFLLSVPHDKRIESLNASVASAIALWELRK